MEKNKKTKIRLISALLTFVMLFGTFSLFTSADEPEEPVTMLEDHFDNLNYGTGAYPPPSENTCAYTAISMMLAYFDAVVNERFVPLNLEWSQGSYSLTEGGIKKTFSESGETNAWTNYRNTNSDKSYADFQVENQFNYLQPYLISIGKILGYHSDDAVANQNPDTYNGFGLRSIKGESDEKEEIVCVLENYLYNTCNFTQEEVTVHIEQESDVGQTALEETIREQIANGYPVIYCGYIPNQSTEGGLSASSSSDGRSGHAMIAYATEDTNEDGIDEDIKLHTGWISSSYTYVSSTDYTYQNAVVWLEISDDLMVHDHTSNENQKDYYISGSYPTVNLCTCEVYADHPLHNNSHIFINSFDNQNHFMQCHCGAITNSVIHSFSYVDHSEQQHIKSCTICDYSISENHMYGNHEKISSTQHESSCVCGDTRTESHAGFEYKSISNFKHEVYCKCGYLIGTSNHVMTTVGTRNICTICGASFSNFSDITIKGAEDEHETHIE